MLGKLIKHEFRATGRIMLPVMGAMLLLALLANLSLKALAGNVTEISALRVVLVLIVVFFGIAVVATGVMALILMVSRFYRNLLKDEGYLMFTLPVSAHELVWSKLIVSLVWFLVTGILVFVVLGLTGLNLSETNLQMILSEFPSWSEIRQVLDEYGIRGQLNAVILQFVLAGIIGGLTVCLHFYAAMALGHMFTKDKILLSIVFYVGISFLLNLISTIFGISMGSTWMNQTFEIDIDTAAEGFRMLRSILRSGIILSAVQGAVLYIGTILGLKRGLNLG